MTAGRVLSKPVTTRAITVQQPWAWAIIHGGKNIENRVRPEVWAPHVGTTLAIHAGKRWSQRGADFQPLQRAYAQWLGFTHWEGWDGGHTAMPIDPAGDERDAQLIDFGAVIGLADLVDVHLERGGCCGPWGEQSYIEHGGLRRVNIAHLVLANPRPITPIDCRGALGPWRLPADISADLEAADPCRPGAHRFIPDAGGAYCVTCGLPPANRRHALGGAPA